MINIADSKKLLVQMLDSRGFQIKKDKSSKQNLVVSDGNETLVLKRGASGDFDYYFNATHDGDYGDTIHFLCRKLLGKDNLRGLSRDEYILIEDVINSIDPTVVLDTAFTSTYTKTSTGFNLDKYKVETLSSNSIIPTNITAFLKKRHLGVNILDSDIRDSFYLLKHDKGFKNLLFLWKNIEGKVVGGQYKFYTSTSPSCIKKFLPDSERSSSLWQTSSPSSTFVRGIFVAEDPLDCLAHREMNPHNNLLYVATGGSITDTQINMIYQLSQKYNCGITLGNDDDLAGWKYNFKIVKNDPNINISIDKNNNIITTTHIKKQEYGSYSLNQFIMLTTDSAQAKGITIEVPQHNDWNNDLMNVKEKDKDIDFTIAQKQYYDNDQSSNIEFSQEKEIINLYI